MEDKYTIINNEERRRFEIPLGAEFARLEYKMKDKEMTLLHTFVPDSHRGKGIADQLAKFALEYLREHKMTALVQCPFVTKYLERHQDYKDVVSAVIKN